MTRQPEPCIPWHRPTHSLPYHTLISTVSALVCTTGPPVRSPAKASAIFDESVTAVTASWFSPVNTTHGALRTRTFYRVNIEINWCTLKHWGLVKLVANWQRTYPNAFSTIKILYFCFKFHWNFSVVYSKSTKYWFRFRLRTALTTSHYLHQWCPCEQSDVSLSQVSWSSKISCNHRFLLYTMFRKCTSSSCLTFELWALILKY